MSTKKIALISIILVFTIGCVTSQEDTACPYFNCIIKSYEVESGGFFVETRTILTTETSIENFYGYYYGSIPLNVKVRIYYSTYTDGDRKIRNIEVVNKKAREG